MFKLVSPKQVPVLTRALTFQAGSQRKRFSCFWWSRDWEERGRDRAATGSSTVEWWQPFPKLRRSQAFRPAACQL